MVSVLEKLERDSRAEVAALHAEKATALAEYRQAIASGMIDDLPESRIRRWIDLLGISTSDIRSDLADWKQSRLLESETPTEAQRQAVYDAQSKAVHYFTQELPIKQELERREVGGAMDKATLARKTFDRKAEETARQLQEIRTKNRRLFDSP
jgi:hypothetical protein